MQIHYKQYTPKMKVKIDTDDFKMNGEKKFSIKKAEQKIKGLYGTDEDYEKLMADYREEMDELQSKMYAHNRYGLLIIFQAMDAAGKDGTIKHVLSGVNPAGVNVVSFKKPSLNEIEHDFLWRNAIAMPQRGSITIFNRSYYEEVLVVKVHPEILTEAQLLPEEITEDTKKLFEQRYDCIKNYEKYLYHNGFIVLKFFLNVSKKEQGKRLIERIEDPSKNWKFEENDINERAHWDEYMEAYEDCINETATKHNPWYVIPADDKKNARLIISKIILSRLSDLKMDFPETGKERREELLNFIDVIKKQDAE